MLVSSRRREYVFSRIRLHVVGMMMELRVGSLVLDQWGYSVYSEQVLEIRLKAFCVNWLFSVTRYGYTRRIPHSIPSGAVMSTSIPSPHTPPVNSQSHSG